MPESSAERDPARVSRATLGLAALALAVAFAIAHRSLRGRILATWQGEEALAPLYAFFDPLLRPQAIAFVVQAAALVLAAPRLVDPDRTSRLCFGAILATASLLLPLGLYAVRAPLADLGTQFDLYQNEEFLHDARRIVDVPGFLDRYVELMPTLSLHGQHFPPGHALLLHSTARLFGPGTFPAALVALGFAAAAVLLAWKAFLEFAQDGAARQGALLLLAAPSLLDFACTSMDAVFLFFATLAWLLGLRAVGNRGSARRAWLAGAALLLATCFSFSALPVGLALLLFAVFRGRSSPKRTAAILFHLLAGYGAAALILFVGTGFPIWSSFLQASESGFALMRHATESRGGSLGAVLPLGNATAFLGVAGVGLVAAFFVGTRRGISSWENPSLATLLALLAMTCSGFTFLETERIWLFALPWIAASAVASGAFDDRSLRRVLAIGFAQALLLEIALFTLW